MYNSFGTQEFHHFLHEKIQHFNQSTSNRGIEGLCLDLHNTKSYISRTHLIKKLIDLDYRTIAHNEGLFIFSKVQFIDFLFKNPTMFSHNLLLSLSISSTECFSSPFGGYYIRIQFKRPRYLTKQSILTLLGSTTGDYISGSKDSDFFLFLYNTLYCLTDGFFDNLYVDSEEFSCMFHTKNSDHATIILLEINCYKDIIWNKNFTFSSPFSDISLPYPYLPECASQKASTGITGDGILGKDFTASYFSSDSIKNQQLLINLDSSYQKLLVNHLKKIYWKGHSSFSPELYNTSISSKTWEYIYIQSIGFFHQYDPYILYFALGVNSSKETKILWFSYSPYSSPLTLNKISTCLKKSDIHHSKQLICDLPPVCLGSAKDPHYTPFMASQGFLNLMRELLDTSILKPLFKKIDLSKYKALNQHKDYTFSKFKRKLIDIYSIKHQPSSSSESTSEYIFNTNLAKFIKEWTEYINTLLAEIMDLAMIFNCDETATQTLNVFSMNIYKIIGLLNLTASYTLPITFIEALYYAPDNEHYDLITQLLDKKDQKEITKHHTDSKQKRSILGINYVTSEISLAPFFTKESFSNIEPFILERPLLRTNFCLKFLKQYSSQNLVHLDEIYDLIHALIGQA